MTHSISQLIGKTLVRVDVIGKDHIMFVVGDDERYKMYHEFDYTEIVEIEDICGDMGDLLYTPILEAEEVTSEEPPEGIDPESLDVDNIWTFYKLRTIKGGVTIRWGGHSNGWYGISVDFVRVEEVK